MKTGRSLTDLAAELARQSETKKDYIADTRRLTMEADSKAGAGVILQGVNGGMTLKPSAHAQLAATLQIPKHYYDRMLTEAPDLLSKNVNNWLAAQPSKKLIRTLDNQVRAVLSDSYRPLDNYDLAEAVLPSLIELGGEFISGEVTDSRLYLKAITPRIQGEVKKGDVVQAGLVISNSEIGHGTLKVEAMDYRLVCTNGMIREAAIRKTHLGRTARGYDALEDAREFFKSETLKADDRAFFLKVKDAVSVMFDEARFTKRIAEYGETAARPIEAEVVEVVEVAAKRFQFSDGEKAGILQHLIKGADLSQWGLANAVTRQAQDVESYDRATELEAIGGQVVELKGGEWKSLAATR